MVKFDSNAYRFKSKSFSPSVAKTIRSFSEERRNIVRGVIAEAERGDLATARIDAVRNNSTESNMIAAAAILESPGALRQREVLKLEPDQIVRSHSIECRTAQLEAAYACGYVNSWKTETVEAIDLIDTLAVITQISHDDALEAIAAAASVWGASNYLARKIAHVKEYFDLTDAQQQYLDAIDNVLDHRNYPLLQFSAIETIMERLSLFSVARRHTNMFQEHVKADFRSIHYLNNLVATPYSESDCAGFLLRAVETSLVDTIYSVLIILNIETRFPNTANVIARCLDPDILARLRATQDRLLQCNEPVLIEVSEDMEGKISVDPDAEDLSLSLYRRSSAFLEFQKLCQYRNDLDMVVGVRLVAPLLPTIDRWYGDSYYEPQILRKPDDSFDPTLHNQHNVKVDTFYRTYLFLRLIQDPQNLANLTSEDIQYIFDNTMRLDSLLLEEELKTMHLNASDEARAIISVLALSLYRTKSSDPDIDFDFREQLEDFIIQNFEGSIPAFIEKMAPESPDVANYIASSLDEATLQKMYSIVRSPAQAENIRRDILTIVGVHLNKIEYIIEAQSIETRSKVAKLKDYFDASRMFVDSLAMKKWLSSNPSAYTEQYKELLPKITARLSRAKAVLASGEEMSVDVLELSRTDAYLVEQIATEAFREFCTNNEFGIESYLGRRIRHNTLHGVMTNSVDGVLRSPGHTPIIAGTPFGRSLATWESGYKIFIERMRREFLQFRDDGKPNALFNAHLDVDDASTRRSLQQLVHTLRLSGTEMLHDLIITFCWQQIGPQLEGASRYIRVKMAQEMVQSLDHALQRHNGPEEQKIKAELTASIISVFSQVASWFQIPQTGFVPASIGDICNIIDIEHNRPASTTVVSGDRLSTKYYGISVHRVYDCLAVLLQNAFQHAEHSSPVSVEAISDPISGTSLHTLTLSVSSILPLKGADECIARVSEAITSTETGRDMVTEGYSGIKKLKFITRLNEGASTVGYDVEDRTIKIHFSIKAEVAGGVDGD